MNIQVYKNNISIMVITNENKYLPYFIITSIYHLSQLIQ